MKKSPSKKAAGRRTDHEGHYFTEERISRSGKKTTYYKWEIRVGGKRVVVSRSSSDERKSEVVKKLAELEAKGFLGQSSKEQTVAQKLNAWLEHRIKPNREYKTYISYKGAIEGYVIPAIGKVKVSKVTWLDLQKIANLARANHHERMASYAPSVACRGLGLSIKEMKREGLELPSEVARDRVLTLEDIVEVLDEAYRQRELKTSPGVVIPVYRDRHLIMFLLNTALRISEALGVIVPRLSLREDHVEVIEQLKREKDKDGRPTWNLGGTKTKQTRKVPLNAEAKESVKLQLQLIQSDKEKAGRGYDDNGLLFATQSGAPMFTQNVLRSLNRIEEAINERRTENGIPPIEHFTLHDLRRSYLTHLAGVEERIAMVAAIAGHANINTTMKHYVFAQEKGMRDAAKKISFSGTKSAKKA